MSTPYVDNVTPSAHDDVEDVARAIGMPAGELVAARWTTCFTWRDGRW
jgi:uncharacterized protein (DUF697 family)